MSNKLDKEQALSLLVYNAIKENDLWKMYQDKVITLEDYCYCLTNWKREKEILNNEG